MGTRLVVQPSPVDFEWSGVEVVQPQLPSEVQWRQPSQETMISFERACQSLGHLGGAYRASPHWLAGLYATATMEAVASAAMVDREANWSRLCEVMADPRRPGALMSPEDRAARLLLAWAGVEGRSGRGYDKTEPYGYQAALRMWPSALDSSGRMPERFAKSFVADLAGWVTDAKQPALVKAATVLLVVSATDPRSADTGIVARSLFGLVLEAADGAGPWRSPPISAWFLHDRDDWVKAATALAADGEPDPGAIDLGMRAIFDAVAHSSIAAAYRVEHSGANVTHRINDMLPAKLTHNQSNLFSVLIGVPSLSYDHIESMLGVTARGARRITRGLIDAGLVVERKSRRGLVYVMASHGFKPCLESVAHYQVPGGPDPYDQRS